mgnify:CR=1 FL=1
MKKQTKNKAGMIDKKMTDGVFALRRKVMTMIYEARELVPNLPRVEVRIVESDSNVLGVATFKGLHISITETSFMYSEEMLRHVVFHELVHTLFKVGHDEKCLLMKSVINTPATKEEAAKLFKKYADKAA